ncbi:MAG TPA: GAF and ANTAR domain-containing protein [Actinocrinis sp.]
MAILSERMTAVFAQLAGRRDLGASLFPATAATLAAAALGVDGVLVGAGTGPQGVVLAWGRQAVGVALEDLQFTLGQGPGPQAAASGVPVLVPDLREQTARWPVFAPGAIDLEVRAVFALPLRIGAISVGVLTAYRAVPGPLTGGQLADALALADAITGVLLDRADGDLAETGGGAPQRGRPRSGRARPATYRAEVHQAVGMISVQLDVSMSEALARLRAYAYGNERPIAEVAADVVSRRLRFEDPDE